MGGALGAVGEGDGDGEGVADGEDVAVYGEEGCE